MDQVTPESSRFSLTSNHPVRRLLGLIGLVACLYYSYVCLLQWEQPWALLLPLAALGCYLLAVSREKIRIDETGILHQRCGLLGIARTNSLPWGDVGRIELFPPWSSLLIGVRVFPRLGEPWEFTVAESHHEGLVATLQSLSSRHRIPLTLVEDRPQKTAPASPQGSPPDPATALAARLRSTAWVSLAGSVIFILGYFWLVSLSRLSLDQLVPLTGELQELSLTRCTTAKSGHSRGLHFRLSDNPHRFRLPDPDYPSACFTATACSVSDGTPVTVWVKPKFTRLKPRFELTVYQLQTQEATPFPLQAYTGAFRKSELVCLGAVGLFTLLLCYALIHLTILHSRRTRLKWDAQ